MKSGKGNYILESREESDRLDKQSRMKAFDFEAELGFLKFEKGQRILDAGCGSGIVSEYLSSRASGISVTGWDFSQDRIDAAQAKYGSAKNLSFSQKNLLELDADKFSGERFDVIVCRYVLRHFNEAGTRKVIQNLYGALKPGGTICCIDVEGLLDNVFAATPFLKEALAQLRESPDVNFEVARQLPSLLMKQGFENVDWHVLIAEFKGAELEQEVVNLQQAIQNAEGFAKKVLGGADNFERFKKEYFSALREPGYVLSYDRVVAMGTKPKMKPKLIENE